MDLQANKAGTYPIYQKPARTIGHSAPPSGCVLDLPGLPGGSKIYDRSPYGNIGTIIGAVWKSLPSGLWCLDFDGSDDYVNCGNPASLQIKTDLTVIAWVSRAVDDAHIFIASKNSFNAKRCWYFSLRNNANNNRVFFYFSKDGTGADTLLSDTGVTGTDWHLVGVTYKYITDGTSQVRLYLDGALDGTKDDALGDLYAENGVDVLIGAGYDASDAISNEFNGKIALPRIYNRDLSALEIQNHYQQEKHLFGIV